MLCKEVEGKSLIESARPLCLVAQQIQEVIICRLVIFVAGSVQLRQLQQRQAVMTVELDGTLMAHNGVLDFVGQLVAVSKGAPHAEVVGADHHGLLVVVDGV
eukprot:CAMPEP_0177680592 /NCGR_PEP_ID=MMETSP0447-20121125/30256_1 /TAXON_ID=0 /ORGANISM="Stygamoeba regulata, Strain BSH-02190019" /LENGTH=101 /DNA_ID=CAMNT_0019189935 /DNA_START=288 /DNA_END=593 /DNA_ORIENTATION=+